MMLKRILLAVAVAIAALAAALAWNTLRLTSRQIEVKPAAPLALERDAVAARLAGALKSRTISDAASADTNADEFTRFQAYLQQAFPRLHATLKREMVGQSMLYTWHGSDAQAKPVMWLAHQDVVPVAPGTEASWQQPPFGGVVKDGFVWGRSSWDDKGSLPAQMEAVETLLAAGYQQRRTRYLGYGADEEVGGRRGARDVRRGGAGDAGPEPGGAVQPVAVRAAAQAAAGAVGRHQRMLRTTTALTVVHAGNKDNVLPGRAGPTPW